jgi:hypothetical protein
MASVTITITDSEDSILVASDFGEAIEDESKAHQCARVLLNSLLGSAAQYHVVEDTVPDVSVEPDRIITTEGANDNGV